MMKQDRTDRILLGCFLASLVGYLVIFVSAFVELPLNISPLHQLLLMFFHFIPQFFLQLLVCRLEGPAWRFALPWALFLVPAFVFVAVTGGAGLAWILAGAWCVAPTLGCALGWLVWGLGCLARRLRKPRT